MDDSEFDRLPVWHLQFARVLDIGQSAGSAGAVMPSARRARAAVATGGNKLLAHESRVDLRASEYPFRVRCFARPGRRLIVASLDQSLAPFQYGQSTQWTKRDVLTAVGSPGMENEAGSDTAPSPDGLSAFIARVLDQLTLSAWLPAAVLTGSLAVLLQFRSSRSANVLRAIGVLTSDPVRVLVITIPLLVIATVVTQAFSFEAIKALEGYWRRRGLASKARTLLIWWHAHPKDRLKKRLGDAYGEALDAARDRINAKHIPESVFNTVRDSLTKTDQQNKARLPANLRDEVIKFTNDWRTYCQPWHLAKIDQLLQDLALYPEHERILPTRLGNVMRATEDKLVNPEGDVEGFALRRYAEATRLVQLQHDQFRNRLEMYCTMVFVSAALALLTPAILIGSGITAIAISVTFAAFAMLCTSSYQAAIASAGGYCAALKEMNKDSRTPAKN
jgi:hypothetical protein